MQQYDDIVIGSGLSALGLALGLPRARKVLMLAGPKEGRYRYYDDRKVAPCEYLGLGGLGNAWHGVIPMSFAENFGESSEAEFISLFEKFYPRTQLAQKLHTAQLFVPWRPIRPATHLSALVQEPESALTIQYELADRFESNDSSARVVTASGLSYQAARLWIAAGAVDTPSLITRSLERTVSTGFISDHVHCYVGLVTDHAPPAIRRNRDGIFFQCFYPASGNSVYTLRPARFAFRRLDFGIEQRAVFGMPTGNAIAKIARRFSPGLLSEAVYNRTGLFPRANTYSVHGQIRVRDAYHLSDAEHPLTPHMEMITPATERCQDETPFPNLQKSRRRDLYMPGIHLHGSIDQSKLASAGMNVPTSPVQVIDASVVENVGPDHHSFKLMLSAYSRARTFAQ